MDEPVTPVDYERLLFRRAASTQKIHGIVSIIFGSFGTLMALAFTLLINVSTSFDESYDASTSQGGLLLVSAAIFIFWTLPHIYLIASGVYLVREPAPKLAKTLVIINLVVGVFWNTIILIFAIINLTQLADYRRGYHLRDEVDTIKK